MIERLKEVIVIVIAVGHPKDQDQDQHQTALQRERTSLLPSRRQTVGVTHADIVVHLATNTIFALIRRVLSVTRRDTTPPIALT